MYCETDAMYVLSVGRREEKVSLFLSLDDEACVLFLGEAHFCIVDQLISCLTIIRTVPGFEMHVLLPFCLN